MGNFFSEKKLTPFVYVQNDERAMGTILRYVRWVPTDPPLGTLAADRPTPLPPPPRPLDPQKFSHLVGV